MIGLIPILIAAKNGAYGEPLCLKWGPDWGAYTAMCNWVQPSHEMACVACHAPKTYWKSPGSRKLPKRLLKHYITPCEEFLMLFETEEDIIYCVAHCWALVLSHALIHGCYLWIQQYAPGRLPALLAVYAAHLRAFAYKAPLSEATHGKD